MHTVLSFFGRSPVVLASLAVLVGCHALRHPDVEPPVDEDPAVEISAEDLSDDPEVLDNDPPADEPRDVQAEVNQHVRRLSDSATSAEDRGRSRAALVAVGPRLPDALAAITLDDKVPLPAEFYDSVLPEMDATFAALQQLQSTDVAERRRAAESLGGGGPLSRLALARLVEVVTDETDAQVWRSVQMVLEGDVREDAIRFHYVALSHPDGEVRRRGCAYLGRHADRKHVAVLLPALKDSSPAVVLEAIDALGSSGPLDDPQPLVQLLTSRDSQMRLAVATALVRLGHDSGADALERLTYDSDPNVRRRAVEAMGESGDPEFLATLIRLVDDRLGVKQAALKSLAKIAGEDIGRGEDPGPPNLPEQIRRWKEWYAQQNRDTVLR